MEYKIKTLSLIRKSRNLTDTIKGFIYTARGSYFKKSYIKYTERENNILPEDVEKYEIENIAKIKRMVKSKPFIELAESLLRENVLENNYNTQIPSEIREWALKIIMDDGIETVARYDGYKLYQDIEYETSSEGWTSFQGASMTTKKATAKFVGINETYEKEFDLGTSGYWN
jgi:hypothetical protein